MPEIDLGRVIGPVGPQGEIGPVGPQGVKGDPGAPATVNGYAVTTIDTDGNIKLTQNESNIRLGLEMDSVPRKSSKKTVESGGVFDSLAEKLDMFKGAGFHNSIYRGKYLGDSVTKAQYDSIGDGAFYDLYIGDYWTIDGHNWRIAAFDYYYNSGNPNCTTHHVTLVPDKSLGNAAMNDSDTTDGGYLRSKMHTTNLDGARTKINSAFGDNHILTHMLYLSSAVTNGYPTEGKWAESTVELMTEQNVYGSNVYTATANVTSLPNLQEVDNTQYPLFFFDHSSITNRNTCWLRNVASGTNFCTIGSYGYSATLAASSVREIRPAFSIKA